MVENIVKLETVMELLVKSVKNVIQIEKNQLKLKKHNLKMKILGIGNAIIDVICRVEDSFIKENSLTKSTMKLVNENEFKKLLSNLQLKKQLREDQLLIQLWVSPSWEIMLVSLAK